MYRRLAHASGRVIFDADNEGAKKTLLTLTSGAGLITTQLITRAFKFMAFAFLLDYPVIFS